MRELTNEQRKRHGLPSNSYNGAIPGAPDPDVLRRAREQRNAEKLADPLTIEGDIIPLANGVGLLPGERSLAVAEYFSAAAWAHREFTEPVRFLGDLVTKTTRTFIVGQTGLGKTMLGIALAAGIANGTGFLNWPCDRPARVLYVDGEMAGELVKARVVDAMRRLGLKDALPNLFVYCADMGEEAAADLPNLGVMLPLNTEAGHAFIYALIDMLGDIDVVIFDNVMSLVVGDQKDEVPWSETMPLVMGLTKRQIGQIWLDHTGHNTERQYGSSTKAWRFDSVGIMTKLSENECSERETGFKLSFDAPGKARRRTSDNWEQFTPRTIRLIGDEWTCDGTARVQSPASSPTAHPDVEQVFLNLLDKSTERKRSVSDSKHASNYAPKLFAQREDAKGCTAKNFQLAMSRLFERNLIALVEQRSSGRNKLKCIVRRDAVTHTSSVQGGKA